MYLSWAVSRPSLLPLKASMVLALFLSCEIQAQQVPPGALRYQRDLIKNVRVIWGMRAPIATFAAQIHQESGWRPDAQSPFAQGMAQFTPSTATWISGVYPDELGKAQPFNPSWAIRALARYDKHLYDGLNARSDCDRWAFTLSAYNGGRGWVVRDRVLAAKHGVDPLRYWGGVERYNNGRAQVYFKENRNYPIRILVQLTPVYRAWGLGVECEGYR